MGCIHCTQARCKSPNELLAQHKEKETSIENSSQQASARTQTLTRAPSKLSSPDGGSRLPGTRTIQWLRLHINENKSIYSKYDLKDKIIGQGVSGVVRVAVHRITGISYAIKSLHLSGGGPKNTVMVRNEVDIYLQLDHPSIARLIDVYEDQSIVYLVMELCSGSELYNKVLADTCFDEQACKNFSYQMLLGLNYCHHKRICHRDLKLENWVFPDESYKRLKLIDFGFGRVFSPIVPMTAMHGTIYYVSPEVMDGCYREKCDMWSLGVIVYMMLCGKPPFSGKDASDILYSIKNNQYDDDSAAWLRLSSEAKSFIQNFLVKDPAMRSNASAGISHPWLRDASFPDGETSTFLASKDLAAQVCASVDIFTNRISILERIVLYCAALSSLSSSETDYLFIQFATMKTGRLSPEELEDGLRLMGYNEDELPHAFSKIDVLQEGNISYSLFYAALRLQSLKVRDYEIRTIIKCFSNSHGKITRESVQNSIGDSLKQISIDSIIGTNEEISKVSFSDGLFAKLNLL